MLEIKQTGEEGIELIQQLAHSIWPEAYKHILKDAQLHYMLELIYSIDALKKQLQDQHQFIIIYDNSNPVGFASYSLKLSGTKNIYRLHKLYVLPNQQGKGTGKYLLNYIIDTIKANGASILELNVNRHNAALHFYNKLGFTITREEDIDIGNGYFMNDYVMELKM